MWRAFSWFMMIVALVLSDPGWAQAPTRQGPNMGMPKGFIVPSGKSFALLIGNESYRGGENFRLKFPRQDVDMVARALREHHGFVTQVEIDVGSDRLEGLIKQFFQKYGGDPEARLLVWFAGHGAQVQVASGSPRSYLLPVDLDITDDASSPAKSRLQREIMEKGVKLDTITEYIDDFVHARQLLVVIDSCFAGAIFDASRRGRILNGSNQLSIERWSNKVRHVIAAGTERQEVYDDGKFAEWFTLAITGRSPALARAYPEFLTGQELGDYLYDAMSFHRRPEQQRPRHRKIGSTVEQEGEFVFVLPSTSIPPLPTQLGAIHNGLSPRETSKSLDPISDRCLTWRRSRHPLAAPIATRVASILNPLRGHIQHTFDADQHPSHQRTVSTIPDLVINVEADGSRLRVRYARKDELNNFGDMVLVPISVDKQSASSDSQVVLRGAWMRIGAGYGCVEFTLDLRAGTGRGLFYQKLRNRLDVDIPFVTQIPVKSSLTFAPPT